MVLLPGGGATALAWRDVAAGLAGGFRACAVDPIGQPGLSVTGERRIRAAPDLTGWLDELLDGLGISRTALAGHSYGGWMALRYSLDRPDRVSRLVLLDPSGCFASMGLAYRLRAVPLLARPSAARLARFLAWETRSRPLDEDWLTVAAAGHELGRYQIVPPRRPRPAELAGLPPVLVLVAGRSRAHDAARVADRARRLAPGATVAVIPDASHHTIPAEGAGQILSHIRPFLGA